MYLTSYKHFHSCSFEECQTYFLTQLYTHTFMNIHVIKLVNFYYCKVYINDNLHQIYLIFKTTHHFLGHVNFLKLGIQDIEQVLILVVQILSILG